MNIVGGPDTVTIHDMQGTGVRVANIDLSAPTGGPDGQADVVTVNGTANPDHIDVDVQDSRIDVAGLQTETRISCSETIDRLEINTLDGNDTVDVAAEVAALISVVVDLGEGQV